MDSTEDMSKQSISIHSYHQNNDNMIIPIELLSPPVEDNDHPPLRKPAEDAVPLPEEAALPSPPQDLLETPICKKRKKNDSTAEISSCQFCSVTSFPDHISRSDISCMHCLERCVVPKEENNEVAKPLFVCSECKTVSSPLWRTGPLGRKTLCNACGLRWAKYNPMRKSKIPREKVDKEIVKKEKVEGKTVDKEIVKKVKVKKEKQEKALDNMNLIRNRKEFITTGLYSNEHRLAVREKGSRFIFPLPMHHGEALMMRKEDFTLPVDIMQENDLELIVKLADRSPVYTKIRTNLFVERKSRCTDAGALICQCIPPADNEVDKAGCGDDCINRMLFYECIPKFCPCGDKCSNQRFQRKEKKKLKICQTKYRGWGLMTLEDIQQGQLIIEYRGEIISDALCKERMRTIYSNQKNFYFLDYSHGEMIDAGRKGSDARFINHSCSPNCHIEKWSLRGESHFGVFASEDIKAHSELFYDYNFANFNGNVESEQICHCQSSVCRGTIGRKIAQKQKH